MLSKTKLFFKIPILVWLSIVFVMGIFVAYATNIPFFIFYFSSFIFLFLALINFKKDKLFYFSFLIFVFFIAGSHLKNTQELSQNHINYIISEDKNIILKGRVISDPVYKKDKISFIFQVADFIEETTAQKISGKVLVNSVVNRNIFYGDELILKGKIQKSSSLYFHKSLEQNQIYTLLKIKDKKDIIYLGKYVLNPLKFTAYKIKHKLKNLINQNLPELQAKFLNAILLGERENIPKTLSSAFIKTGTAHIIAISGLHVGIVALILWVILKIFRIKRKMRCFLIIFFLLGYCFLTGARASMVRATIMAIILFLGYVLEKDSPIYNSLSLAGLIILMFNPNQLFDIGFQLSFLCVWAIVYLSPKIEKFILKFAHTENYFLKNFIVKSFAISLACWLVTSPIILYNFRIFSPITIFANLIIVPYVTLITAVGFVLILGGLILPFWVGIFAISEAFLIGILFEIAIYLSKIPGAYFIFH